LFIQISRFGYFESPRIFPLTHWTCGRDWTGSPVLCPPNAEAGDALFGNLKEDFFVYSFSIDTTYGNEECYGVGII